MQTLAEICIRRPIFAVMLILALVVVGATSYFRLGVDRFPAVDLPIVTVRTTLPGAAPEDVETEVSEVIEGAVNTVEGLSDLRSISFAGQSAVIATFDLSRDIDTATQDVRDRVQGVLRNLPDEADPPIIGKQDNDSAPVLTVALSANRSIRELTELADKRVKVVLERAAGVGDVSVNGGQERAIKLWIDADRLAAYGLPITAVRDAIRQQNSNVPGGNVTTGLTEETLRTMGRVEVPQEFGRLVVGTVNGAPIRLQDIGTVEDGTVEQRSLARLNGVPTVILEVRRQSGANTVAVIEAVKANLAKIQGQLPADVKLELIRDQSRYIYTALHEINIHLILGSFLASLVVFLFMRSWRSTLIAAVAIPASVISTFGMMWALDFTLNGVTMLALVLMVGIVIDDAIVVLENIFRFVEEKRMHPMEAAKHATAEIGLAVLATTLSLVVIFVPVSFMSSISGRFLYQFGITAAVAVLVSLLVSFTLTPMMSARLLKGVEPEKEKPEAALEADGAPAVSQATAHSAQSPSAQSRGGFYARIDRTYARALTFAMNHRAIVAVLALAVIGASVPLYGMVKQEYTPSDVDEAEFEVNINGPLSASLTAMDEVMRRVGEDIEKVRGVRTVLVQVGGGFVGGVNNGSAFVRIAPHEERVFSLTRLWRETLAGNPLKAWENNYTQRDVMVEVRKTLKKYRDVRASVRNLSSFNIGGGNFDIDYSILGPDLEALAGYAEALREKSVEIGGIVDADTSLKLNKPELRVVIDRNRAADLGVRIQDIATALRLMVGGDPEVTRYRDNAANDSYNVQLRLLESDRNRAEVISRLYVPRTAGVANGTDSESALSNTLVRLDNLVKLEHAPSASRVDRLDRQRIASLRAGVAPGYALADRLEALTAAVADLNLPAGYTTTIRGRGRELERTFTEFLWAFLLSVIFMYMILASQFESVTHPFTILLSLPLSVPFALFSLWATGNTLNLYSALGILVLFGVVKKNSILQVDHMNKLREAGMSRADAILQGNRDRLRPILMTTLALVAGMLPLWVGTGPGSEERRAIAVVVIGGQSLSLALTLIVTPVAYSLLDDLSQFMRRRRQKAQPQPIAATLVALLCLVPTFTAFGMASESEPAPPPSSELLTDLTARPLPPMPGLERLGISAGNPLRLTLAQAIERALAENLDVKIAASDLKSSEGQLLGFQGAFDPVLALAPTLSYSAFPESSLDNWALGVEKQLSSSLDISPTLTHRLPTGLQYQLFWENTRETTNALSADLNPEVTSRLGVSIVQPLARNFALDRYRRDIQVQSLSVEQSESALQLQVMEVVTRVQLAWWELVFARQELENRTVSLELAREQFRSTEARVAAGTTSPLERAEVAVGLSSREVQLLTALKGVSSAETALKQLLLKDVSAPEWQQVIEPVQPPPFAPQPVTLETALELARAQRPELVQSRLAREQQELQQHYFRNQTLPQVDLVSSLSTTGLAGQPVVTEPATVPDAMIGGFPQALRNVVGFQTPQVSVGLSVALPLGNRAARGALAVAQAELEQLQAREQLQRLQIEAEVRQAVQALELAHRTVLAARLALESAELLLSGEQRLYEQGRSTAFLVFQRVEGLSSAKTQVLRAETDYHRQLAELQRATGETLKVHHIQVKAG